MYKHDLVNINKVLETLSRELSKLEDSLPFYGEVVSKLKNNEISNEDATVAIMSLVADVNDFSEYWRKYCKTFKLAVERDVERLNIKNKLLTTEVDRLNGENKALADEIARLESLMVNNQVTERANQLLDMIQDRVSQIAQSEKLKRKEIAPALRVDVSDKDIVEMFKSGMTAYSIGKACGMTQQAIIYRLKKLGLK